MLVELIAILSLAGCMFVVKRIRVKNKNEITLEGFCRYCDMRSLVLP